MRKTNSKPKVVSKKQIRSKIEASVTHAIGEFKVDRASKKIKREIEKASRKIANRVSDVLRKTKKKIKKAKTAKVLNGQKLKSKAAV